MIEFSNHIHSRIQVRPMYYELGFSPSSRIFARRTLLNRLLRALDSLPPTYGFLIWDAYRPREVQSRLFDWMKEEIQKNCPI